MLGQGAPQIEVTFIARSGEAVLARMMSHGAESIARDVNTKQLPGDMKAAGTSAMQSQLHKQHWN
jgi:hypothetical protein